jgi:hypothetical protein
MFKKRAIIRAGVAACLICAWLAPMLWGVRQIRRHAEREQALELLNANGLVTTIVLDEEKWDEFLASSMIWSPKPTLLDRIKGHLPKADDFPIQILVPQAKLSLVPNLRDLFSPEELIVIADGP